LNVDARQRCVRFHIDGTTPCSRARRASQSHSYPGPGRDRRTGRHATSPISVTKIPAGSMHTADRRCKNAWTLLINPGSTAVASPGL
jgi:hypothetical protein